MASSDQYDFFVSYARVDNATAWISTFIEELLAEHQKFAAGRDLTYFFDKHEIGAGADWQHTLNHGIAHSKLFVAFISPNYFASEWCRKEWRAWIDAEIAKHILTAGVRPVYIVEVPGLTDGKLSDQDFAKQIADFLKISEGDRIKLLVETPPVVKHLRRRQMTHNQPFCDVHSFYTEGVETLRRDDLRQVLSKLAQDLDHHAELLAKADASDYTIHPYNKNFSGRLDELLQLREWLDKDDRTGVIHGVHGLGGIGKTELALTYAHGYASAYPGGRYLISCDGKASLSEAIRTQNDFILRFADKISDDQRKDPDEFYAAVLFHLGKRIEKLGHVLLLLDNVTDAALFSWEQTDVLTKLGPKLHLLATTRLSAPTTNKNVNETDDHKTTWISLDRLPDEDALDLLEKHRPFMNDEDREAARNIVKQLDGFTLAIELTAAYLAAKNSTSYAWMNKCLNIDALEKMANSDVKLRRHNHERRLSAILKPILEELQPAELHFMEYAALLPPEQVPLPWLKELVTQDFPELLEEEQLENPWDEVWQKLEKLSLISRTKEEAPEPRIFRVHRLVQELVKAQSSVSEFELSAKLLKLINNRVDTLISIYDKTTNRWEIDSLTAFVSSFIQYCNRDDFNICLDIIKFILGHGKIIESKKLAEVIIVVEEAVDCPNKFTLFDAYLVLGSYELQMGNDRHAAYLFDKAEQTAVDLEVKSKYELLCSKTTIAIRSKNYIDARKYCIEAMNIDNIPLDYKLPLILNMSTIELDEGNPDRCLEIISPILLSLDTYSNNNYSVIGKIFINLAIANLDNGNHDTAFAEFENAIKYFNRIYINNNTELAECYYKYGISKISYDTLQSLELLEKAKIGRAHV